MLQTMELQDYAYILCYSLLDTAMQFVATRESIVVQFYRTESKFRARYNKNDPLDQKLPEKKNNNLSPDLMGKQDTELFF